MFPSDLLSVWKRKGEILPRYAKPSSSNDEAANILIEAYKVHVGEKKKVLKALVTELEDKGYEYRFVRALSLLLDRKSTFICNSKIDPVDLRRKIFQITENFGVPTTSEMRLKILTTIASEMALKLEDVETNFYSDLENELVLEKFTAPSASELLSEYNLGLTQTLLFDAIELSFTASGNWQDLFHAIKKFGLIYEVYRENSLWVKIDGPSSLFKLTRRYGVGIAKLLPIIVANPEWTVKAKILWKFTNEICDFKIESQKYASLLKRQYLPTVTYDSSTEVDFAVRFQALGSGWVLKREPEPVTAGKQVIIPDFSFERAGIRVYLEIVGFWTEEYLLRKIDKLKQVETKMLLLVNEALACEKLSALEKRPHLDLIYYREKIPLAPILRYLETKFEKVKSEEMKLLEGLRIKFTEPIVVFREFAARIGISPEAARSFLTINPPSGYVGMADTLISNKKLQQIDTRMKEASCHSGKLPFKEATRIIEEEGVDDSSNVLSALGYKIRWRGIDSDQAEVYMESGNNVDQKK
jgi:predicted nuclease of restriction endonuclease-like RecB superfamily